MVSCHRTIVIDFYSFFLAGESSEWVEALGWRRQEDKDQVTGNSHEWHYHWKADELKRANPSALVPTVIPIITTADGAAEPDESRAVYESVVVVEYVDAESGADPRDRLVPSNDPYQAARCRIWTDKVNRECCSPY
jgi:glutathione S-transferase